MEGNWFDRKGRCTWLRPEFIHTQNNGFHHIVRENHAKPFFFQQHRIALQKQITPFRPRQSPRRKQLPLRKVGKKNQTNIRPWYFLGALSYRCIFFGSIRTGSIKFGRKTQKNRPVHLLPQQPGGRSSFDRHAWDCGQRFQTKLRRNTSWAT